MNARGAILCLFFAAATALAQEQQQPEARNVDGHFSFGAVGSAQYKTREKAPYAGDAAQARAASENLFRITPLNQQLYLAALMRYPTMADYPDYSRDYDGRGISVPNGGSILRSNAAIGIESGPIYAGDCFPANPDDPNSPCLMENDANGFPHQVWKERERWVFRVSYIDPTNPTAAEVNIGFPTPYGTRGDDEIAWVRHTSAGRACFTAFATECNLYGFDLYDLLNSARGFAPDCGMKLGAGYRASVFYQSSRYRITDTIPPGVPEWVPATIPATSTRLAKPGYETWHRDFILAPREDAMRIGTAGLIHPEVEAMNLGGANATGGSTNASIPPGQMTLSVDTIECNVPISGVTFTLLSYANPTSGGHIHDQAGATLTPPDGAFSDLPTSVTGTTDANGHWQTTVHGGRFAGITSLVAETNNIRLPGAPSPFRSKPGQFSTGFLLSDYIPTGVAADNILLVGGSNLCASNACLNHRDVNHRGRPELKTFVDLLAFLYNQSVNVAAGNKGRIGVNDMSLPLGGRFDIGGTWAGSHSFHRFGVDVDINHSVYDAAGNVLGDLDEDEMDSVVFEFLGGQKVTEDNIHYRLPATTIDAIINRINVGGF